MSDVLVWMGEHWLWTAVLGTLVLLALYDVLQKRHAILHNFPVVGHLRYILESIGPELRQYLVAHDKEEKPFNRDERRYIYATAKGENSNFGFGTTEALYADGYPIIKHAAFPLDPKKVIHRGPDKTALYCLKVMGESHKRRRPYRPSLINIAAMSYGSLGRNATSALNLGARETGCFHNTGEGGVSPYHLLGGDLMWQLGTGYYGARNPDGTFSMEKFVAQVEQAPAIRAIEVKLSQGAKPGKGGILPAAKVTAEISQIRGIPAGKACLSPNHHASFGDVDGMIDFIESLAEASGLPIGIKSAVGDIGFWNELAERMKVRNQGPDFITIDGGEGGTGAAPLTYSDHVSLPFEVAFTRVYKCFQTAGISRDIVWLGSGKRGFPDRTMVALAMGCDAVQIAREPMLAIGCIQALQCHTGHCPAGVATHNKWLQAGLDIQDKSGRFARYIKGLRTELLTLAHSMGYEHPSQVSSQDIEFSAGTNQFHTLAQVIGYNCDIVEFTTLADYGPVETAQLEAN